MQNPLCIKQNYKNRCYRFIHILAAIITWATLICPEDAILALEKYQVQSADTIDVQSTEASAKETIKGYPAGKRRIGTPMDVEWNLDNSFPKSGSLLELILDCSDDSPQPTHHRRGSSHQPTMDP